MSVTKKPYGWRRNLIADAITVVINKQLGLNGCIAFKLTLKELRQLTKKECGGNNFNLPSLELLRAIRGDAHLKEHYSISGFKDEEIVTFYSREVMIAVSQVEKAIKAEEERKLELAA